jgi:alkanesulfonate monooxygenase SsuD/methylene tetrahydromethanopterin reductase-like flavin-dependent oxidoreductase (luciferase family)
MGVEFRRRWPMTREYVRAMKELWTRDEASFEGEFVRFSPVRSNPKPAQKPHPPVHVGAGGERALKNTALIGDGWAPIALKPDDLKSELVKLKRLCDEAGRDFAKMEISVFSPLGEKDSRAAVEAYRAAGAHRLVLFPPSLSPESYERELETLARAWVV